MSWDPKLARLEEELGDRPPGPALHTAERDGHGSGCTGTRYNPAQAAPQKKPVTPEEELKALRQKAEQGDASSQFRLGLLYASGKAVPQEDAQALVPSQARWEGSVSENADHVVLSGQNAFCPLR